MDEREKLRQEIHALYNREHAALGEEGTLDHLKRGDALCQKFDLARTLANGGILVFPHAGVDDCGYQIAACVQAALDSGVGRVVVISVLHAFTESMEEARIAVANGAQPSEQPFYGIQGPGIETPGRDEWSRDHALISWRYFWNAEIKRRGLSPDQVPEMIERYPWLAGGKPEELPGIEELKELCEDAVIVSTADPFHHGIGYGTPAAEAFNPDEAGLAEADRVISAGLETLGKGDYWGFNQHCVEAKSDARDAGQTYRYIRGPMRGKILDMAYSDSAELYQTPAPTWVAAPLVRWELQSDDA